MRPILRCKRCDYRWGQRFEGLKPKTCPNPKCRSPYWNKPRRTPKE